MLHVFLEAIWNSVVMFCVFIGLASDR